MDLQSLVGIIVEVLVLFVWFVVGHVPSCLFAKFRLRTFLSLRIVCGSLKTF